MAFISPFSLSKFQPTRSRTEEISKSLHQRFRMSIDRRTCLQYIAQSAVAISFLNPSSSGAAMYSADTKADQYAPTGDPKKVET